MSNLKLIDFSDGIRSEEIQHNFTAMQDELNRERMNVGGSGIASGLELDIVVNDSEFAIELSEASIIANDGSEIYIESQKVNIEPPKLSKEIEYLTMDYNNQIALKHIPYALNRRLPVEYCSSFAPHISGMDIKYQDSTNDDDYIRARAINGKTIILSGAVKRNVTVTYYYTAKRIDTVYLDENYEVKVISGITSSTPSITMPTKYKYLIAFVEVDSTFTDDKNTKMRANIIVRKDLRKVRNLYTDTSGMLWICGIPFKDLQIIHMIEPKSPSVNTMWYDEFTNQLKVWKSTDKLVYMNEYTVTTDYVANPDLKKDYTTDVYFYTGKEQISIYINDIKLDDTQFSEIYNSMPVDKQDIENKIMTNCFRILEDLEIGDKITYKIENFDMHYMWVPVNHSSFVNARETKLFGPNSAYENNNYFATEEALAMGSDADSYPYKYQYFLFHRETDLNMLFTPNKKELTLLINQTPLHIDQYEEITVNDLYDAQLPDEIVNAAASHFGWDKASIEKYSGEYDNLGIGFRLKEPLDVELGAEVNGDVDLYVEANVQRRVNDGPLKRKLQRTATFVNEKTVTVVDTAITKIDIEDGYYRFGENQLEVYLNGIKLINGVSFSEASDLSPDPVLGETGAVLHPAPRTKGAISRQFDVTHALATGDKVTYKITTSVYSYDHINSLIDELDYNAMTAVKKVDALYDKTVAIQQDMEATVADLETELEEIQTVADNLDGKYLTKDSVITISQLPPTIVSNGVQSLSHITTALSFQSGTLNYSVKNYIRQEDFIVAFKRDVVNGYDRLLIRDVDYSIYNLEDSNGYSDTVFSLTNNAAILMNHGDMLIFTGIKFGKAGR
jgi:hypothetical protein